MKVSCGLYTETVLHLWKTTEKDKSVTVHQRNLQVLATEIFKTKNGLTTKLMKTFSNS